MKSLLENLGNVGTEVSSKLVSNYASLDISLEVEIRKGSLTKNFNGWLGITTTRFKGFYEVEIRDYEDGNASIGNLKIDDLQALTKTLNESGLSSLGKELVIEDEEVRKAFYRATQEMEEVKMMFKDCKCYDLLSVKEQLIEVLKITKVEDIKNLHFSSDRKELVQDLLELEVITQKDINAKIKELSK